MKAIPTPSYRPDIQPVWNGLYYDTEMKIGFQTGSEQGPGIFLSRLKVELEKLGRFSVETPDVWIQLSFERLPEHIIERRAQGLTKVFVRMDGCYSMRHHKFKLPFGKPLAVPIFDEWYSVKVNWRKNTTIRENLLSADGIIFQSEFSRLLTQRFVSPTKPGVIVYNGVPLEDFSPSNSMPPHPASGHLLPKGEGIPSKDPDVINLIMSHSFQPYHRLHDAFKILAVLKHVLKKPVHLNILGGDNAGAFRHAKQLAPMVGVKEKEDYTFLGKRPYTELGNIYRACDLMLNLSYWDTCPNVVIEALACGLPIVGVNHGGVAELIGDGGVLVNEDIGMTYHDHLDPLRMPQAPVQDYIQAIQTALKKRDKLSEKARARAEKHFDIKHIATQYQHALGITE